MDKGLKHSALIKMFLEFKHYGLFIMSVLFSILSTVRDLSVAITLADAINAVMANNNVAAALISVGIAALSGLPVRALETYFHSKYRCSCQRYVLNCFSQRMLDIPMLDFEAYQSGDLLARYTTETERLLMWLSEVFPGAIRLIAYTIGMFIYGLTQSVPLTIIVYPVILVIAPLLMRLSKPLSEAGKIERDAASKSLVQVLEILTNPEIIKTFCIEPAMNKRVDDALTTRANIEKKAATTQAITNCIAVLGSFVPGFIAAAVGVFFLANGWITVGFLVSFVQIAIIRIGRILSQAADYITATRRAEASAARVSEVLSFARERTDGETGIPEGEDTIISFKNVSFSYPNQDKILDHVSFTIKRGETIALVGPSGCGKSTLLKLILGYYEPQEGSIRVYGRKVQNWNLKTLRDLFAIVFQDLFLFPVSIRENLTAVKENVTTGELENAILAAGLEDFIAGLPDGVDTILGERGVTVSGGQRQRLTIGRAFIKNAPILLLDEPTSALDSVTEAALQRSLDRLLQGKTTIVVAHRLKTIRNADRIFVMENGKIVQVGTHEELIAVDHTYRRLYQQQAQEDLGGNAYAS